jgi:hypothetical protein
MPIEFVDEGRGPGSPEFAPATSCPSNRRDDTLAFGRQTQLTHVAPAHCNLCQAQGEWVNPALTAEPARTRSHTMANYQATPQPSAADPGNTLGIVGLILAIIPCTSTIGLVLSIVAYIVSRRAGFQNGKALAGIIVGAAWLILGLILQLTMGLLSGIFQMNS